MRGRHHLQQGRASFRRRAWREAYRLLAHADQTTPLDGADLERLAESAYLIGQDADCLRALNRAHHAYLDAGAALRAVRCASWLALLLVLRGETSRATGWLARAHRLLTRTRRASVEEGYLRLPAVERHLDAEEWEAAYTSASLAVEIGDRFRDEDLVACGRHLQGRTLIGQGRTAEGLGLLDETMVAVTAGELSPIITGLLYCSVIDTCWHVWSVSRACEWTSALTQWCEGHQEMVAFTGTCLAHRAEIMQLQGAWQAAIEEAQHACDRFSRGLDPQPPAAAVYQQAEVHRLRGDLAAAEKAYRTASQWGWDPQPGLALLRLTQGRTEAAVAAIRRAMRTTRDRFQRAKLLPAYIDIMLTAEDATEARRACRELQDIASSFDTGMVGALAALATGAVELADGRADAAMEFLRRAWRLWQQLDMPYMAARARIQLGLACRALGDHEGSQLELDAARTALYRLGAVPDIARIDALQHTSPARSCHPRGLTPRERQVLRLIAAGRSNKAIAIELSLSVKTVDRHVSNIFDKLDVPSRAAAAASAYERKLL